MFSIAAVFLTSVGFGQTDQVPRVNVGPIIALENTLAGDNTLALSCPITVSKPVGVVVTAQLLVIRNGKSIPVQTLTHEWSGSATADVIRGNVSLFCYDRSRIAKSGQHEVFIVSGFKANKKLQSVGGAGGGGPMKWTVGKREGQWWKTHNPKKFPSNEQIVVGMLGRGRQMVRGVTIGDLERASKSGEFILACTLQWDAPESASADEPGR